MPKMIEALNFVNSFKHGVYVCTSDSCGFCEELKKSLSGIDSPHLYAVEAVTEDQKQALWNLADRIGFPQTLCFWKNELAFVKRGSLYGEDLKSVLDFLAKFPKTDMSEDERNKLQKDVSGRCKLALYIFPPGLSKTARMAALNAKLEHNELAIDVDEYASSVSDYEDKVRLFAGVLKFSKLVVFNIFSTGVYSDLAQELLKRYAEDVNGETTIEHREVQEAAESR